MWRATYMSGTPPRGSELARELLSSRASSLLHCESCHSRASSLPRPTEVLLEDKAYASKLTCRGTRKDTPDACAARRQCSDCATQLGAPAPRHGILLVEGQHQA